MKVDMSTGGEKHMAAHQLTLLLKREDLNDKEKEQ